MRFLQHLLDPDWRKFKRFPVAVQIDVFALARLHAELQATVVSRVSRSLEERGTGGGSEFGPAAVAMRQLEFIRNSGAIRGELHLSVLSTIVGNEFTPIEWRSFHAHQSVGILGAIAIRQFRKQTAKLYGLEIQEVGYAAIAIEAEAQFLSVAASQGGFSDWRADGRLVACAVRSVWRDVRTALLEQSARQVACAMPASANELRAWLRSVPPELKGDLLDLAGELANHNPSLVLATPEAQKPALPPDPTVRLAQLKRDHPVVFIPIPAFERLQLESERHCREAIASVPLSNYEVQRLTGIPSSAVSAVFDAALVYDSKCLANAMIIAAAKLVDPQFHMIGGTSRGLLKIHDHNSLPIGVQLVRISSELGCTNVASQARLMQLWERHWKSAQLYIDAPRSDRAARLQGLLHGSIMLGSLARFPRLEPVLVGAVEGKMGSLVAAIGELSKGELWDFDQQSLYVQRQVATRTKPS
jgi:hypothetical protein